MVRYLLHLAMAVGVASVLADPPEVAELTFDASFRSLTGHPHATNSWPAWVVRVDQQDGEFLVSPPCWQALSASPVGSGRLTVSLDRSLMQEDLAVALLYEGDEHTD